MINISELNAKKTICSIAMILLSVFLTESIVFGSNVQFLNNPQSMTCLSPQVAINISPFQTEFKTIAADFSNLKFSQTDPHELFELYEISHYLRSNCRLFSKSIKKSYETQRDKTQKSAYYEGLFFSLRKECIKREKSFEIILHNFAEKKLVSLAGMRLLDTIRLYHVRKPIDQIFPRILPNGIVLWSQELFGDESVDFEFKLFCYVYAVNRLFFHTKSQSMGRTLLYFQELKEKQKKIIIDNLEKFPQKDKKAIELLGLVKKYQRLTLTQVIQKDIVGKFIRDPLNDVLEIVGLAQSSIGKTTPEEMKEDIHDFLNTDDSDVQSEDGTRIHYIYGGNKQSALSLFFLHGITQNSTTWRTMLSWFEDWAKIITMDGRGHGKSGASQDKSDPDIKNAIRDLKAVAHKLHLENIVTIGYSKGGVEVSNLPQITQSIDVQNFVDGLILISTTFANPFRSFLGRWNEQEAEILYKIIVNLLEKLGSEKKGIISRQINEVLLFSYRYTYFRKIIDSIVSMTVINPDLKVAVIDYMENFAETSLREIALRLKAFKIDNLHRLRALQVPVHWIIGINDQIVATKTQIFQSRLIRDVSVDHVKKAKHAPLINDLKHRISGIYDFLLARVYPRICLRYMSEILTYENIDRTKVAEDLEILSMFENLDLTQKSLGLAPIIKDQNDLDIIVKELLRARGDDAKKLKAVFHQRKSEKLLIAQLQKTFNIFHQNRNNLSSINKDKLLDELEKNTRGLRDLVIDSWNEKTWGDILPLINKYFDQAELVSVFAALNAMAENEGISEQESLSRFAQGWLMIQKANETTGDLYMGSSFLKKNYQVNRISNSLVHQSI